MGTSPTHHCEDSSMLAPFGPSCPGSREGEEIFSWGFCREDSLGPNTHYQLTMGAFFATSLDKRLHRGEELDSPSGIWSGLEWGTGREYSLGRKGSS
jgi:hypothetical protein